MRRLLLAAVLLAAMIVAATAQAAATLYVSPSGPASGDCTSGTPCELQFALDKAADGDTIEIAAGTYSDADGYKGVTKVTLHGADGDRPVIKSTTAGSPALDVGGTSSTLQHLSFGGVTGAPALDGKASDVRISDVVVVTPGPCLELQASLVEGSSFTSSSATGTCATFTGEGTVKNSDFTTTAASAALSIDGQAATDVKVTSGGVGVTMGTSTSRRLQVTAAGNGVTFIGQGVLTDSLVSSGADAVAVNPGAKAKLRNVSASGVRGIFIAAETNASVAGGSLEAVNVIGRGPTAPDDVVLEPAKILCVDLSCSTGQATFTYSNVRTTASTGLSYGAGMLTTDPQFVSLTNLHIQAGSPMRNVGTSADVDSTTDVDGDPRVGDGTIDIGGDEFTVPVQATPTATPTATATPEPDRTKPTFAGVRPGKKGRVFFSLSEPAEVSAAIARKAGRRFRAKGRQVFAGQEGGNTIRLRVKGAKLKPGKYRITLIATDLAGNKSAKATVRLKVKKKR